MTFSRLVISPHIDDEILGCGGILDDKCFVIECGVDEFHVVSREERIIELQNAALFLGFSFEILNGQVNSYNRRDFIEPFTRFLNKIKPTEVYIPYPSYNQDHQEIYQASIIALRPQDLNFFVPRVLVYEETQVLDWDYGYSLSDSFKPNFFKEIDIDRKLIAYQMLESQVRPFRSPEYLREMASLRGRQSGLRYAEAFMCLRNVESL